MGLFRRAEAEPAVADTDLSGVRSNQSAQEFDQVDLPAPFSPTIARTSPVAMASETSSSATVASKRLERCSTDNRRRRPGRAAPAFCRIKLNATFNSLLPRPNRAAPPVPINRARPAGLN